MDALIITAPGTIANPEAYLPDIQTGLYYDVRAKDFTLPDGPLPAPIITSRGSAPEAQRTFGVNTDAARTLPGFSNYGGLNNGKYFTFNGVTSRLQNITGNPTIWTATATDFTFYCLFKNTKHPAVNAPFLCDIVSLVNPLRIWLDNDLNGHNFLNVYNGTTTRQQHCPTLNADDWTFFCLAQNSTTTTFKIGNNDIFSFAQPRLTYQGLLLGSSWGAGDPPGAVNGGFARWGMYTRKLTDNDIGGLYLDVIGS